MKTLKLSTISFCLLSFVLFSCQKTAPTGQKKPPVVTAGPSQAIILPLDSVTLAGKAVDSSSTIVAYLWSEVSGPNVPVIEDEGSLSTRVTGLTAGTYIFQLMATDTFGLTGVDTMEVVVSYPTKGNSITLSPVHNPYEIEFIGSTQLNYSEGQYPQELGAEEWTINSIQVGVRSVFKFDLSSLTNTNIASAKLSLYSNPTPFTANLVTPNYGSSNAFYIQRVNENWDPTTETWLTQPTTDSTAEVLIPQTNLSTLDLPNIDVTQLVKNMLSSGNYGFEMRLQNEVIYNSRIFCSSSYSDSTKRPVLVINY
ncbi:MAG TPA: DNRLRE domain-containing protein [Puia sp.]|jgi:hypothetical protein|nr:DNRLRE domain-containing protein [Puia sp.]